MRLAPGEPFVPAFRIPESSTQRLQPKLITEHRDGGEAGGTPGAMLSHGNLNTAALTLFIALHQLGWDGLITNNYKMLDVPTEVAATVKTKAVVVAIEGLGRPAARSEFERQPTASELPTRCAR